MGHPVCGVCYFAKGYHFVELREVEGPRMLRDHNTSQSQETYLPSPIRTEDVPSIRSEDWSPREDPESPTGNNRWMDILPRFA
jgi:hypothetical protein